MTSHHPSGSVIFANDPQMWELKRVHAVHTSNRTTRLPMGPNEHYRLRQNGRLVRGADRRATKVPSEYEAKTRKADDGSTAVLGALRALPRVRGIALGAFGEFSESASLLTEGLAHEGDLKNPDKFGQSNYQAAFGLIDWWLQLIFP